MKLQLTVIQKLIIMLTALAIGIRVSFPIHYITLQGVKIAQDSARYRELVKNGLHRQTDVSAMLIQIFAVLIVGFLISMAFSQSRKS